jgi:hypothetical protein
MRPQASKSIAALFLLWITTHTARAVDAIVLEVREISVAGVAVQDASVRLDLPGHEKTRLTVAARSAKLPDPVGILSALSLVCDAPVIAEPRFACDAGKLSGRGGPTGNVDMRLQASYDMPTATAQVSGEGLGVAGTTAKFRAVSDSAGWRVRAETGTTSITALRAFAKPWYVLPADITGDGRARIRGTAQHVARPKAPDVDAEVTLELEEVSLTNEASTIVTDGMSATLWLKFAISESDPDTALRLRVNGEKGQVLAGPVLLDFGKNPLGLHASGKLREQRLAVSELLLQQKDLVELAGSGSVNLAGATPLVSGDFELRKLEFPAAYPSYLQITLASSMLGDLDSAGGLRAEMSVRDNALTSLHMVPESLVLHDKQDRLHLSRIHGDIYWAPEQAQRSKIGWAEGGAFGLSGGAAELEFLAQGDAFSLTRPTKLPVLDGALAIDTLAVSHLGASNMEVAFKGAVEPISMPRLAAAFGWPQFQGTLAASIPGVTLKDNVLAFQGNVESQVFGGRIVGSNIRLQDPLGNFPQFFADVRARDLDLGLVTQTFEVGSITGRLDADILNLELFGWSPVAFDARLATPRSDKSRHRISAKAVTSLSNVGGGGGGVVKALQSGVLQFFDEYSYEKLGITCKLRNDICEMSGIEPAGIGYYIVKGAGVPRIDIVGNAGRVRWSQLLQSITTTNFGDATTE